MISNSVDMVMDVEDNGAGTSMDTSEPGPILEEIEWRFSQVKGNVDSDDFQTDGERLFVRTRGHPSALVKKVYIPLI